MLRRAVAQLLHGRQPVTLRAMLALASTGLLCGLVLGYILMGSVHTVLEFGSGPRRPRAQAIHAAGATSDVFAKHEAVAVHDAAATTDIPKERPFTAKGDAKPFQGAAGWPTVGSTVHTLCTSNGSPYTNFQNRIMYATYKLAQKQPGGELMAGFTRILHRTVEDELMQEIPTFRAMPLTPKCDGWCEFPVADRPNAVRQFFAAAAAAPDMIKAPWVLMLETDYVWMAPLQGVPRAESGAPGWAFPYGYIVPTHPGIQGVMRAMYPEDRGPLSDVPNTGPAPILMRAAEWLAVVPDWERLAAYIEATPEAKARLGWVREMYAFSIATALQGVRLEGKLPPESPLMVQPPADHSLGAAALCHYTWGSIFKDSSQGDLEVWKFDKRFYTSPADALKVPQLKEPIEWRPGLRAIGSTAAGVPVTPELVELLRRMIRRMNTASAPLPQLQRCPRNGCSWPKA